MLQSQSPPNKPSSRSPPFSLSFLGDNLSGVKSARTREEEVGGDYRTCEEVNSKGERREGKGNR